MYGIYTHICVRINAFLYVCVGGRGLAMQGISDVTYKQQRLPGKMLFSPECGPEDTKPAQRAAP